MGYRPPPPEPPAPLPLVPGDPDDVPLPLEEPEPEVEPEPDVEPAPLLEPEPDVVPGALELPDVPGVGVVPVVPVAPGVDVPVVPLVPGRLDVPAVPLFGLELGVLLAPLQLADSIRTELTVTRGLELFSSAVPDVPSGDEERRLRVLRRDVVERCGISRPVTSTCCPSWPARTSGPSRTNSFADPLVPVLPLMPLLPALDAELDVADVDGPYCDGVLLLPDVIRALLSVNDGAASAAACPRRARVPACARAELVPDVAVLDADALPVVPTAPLVPPLPIRQPTSVTSWAWVLAACDVRAERVRRCDRGVVCVVPL